MNKLTKEFKAESFRTPLRALVLQRQRVFLVLVILFAMFGIGAQDSIRAQSAQPKVTSIDSTNYGEILPATAFAFAGIGGFIPMRESYRINYGTSLIGLPIELMGGLSFPVSPTLVTPITVRYIRRTANFVSGTSVSVLSFEPGVRGFLEKRRDRDLRIFAGAEGILGEATVSSTIDASSDGSVTGAQDVEKQYIDLGLGFDLGFTWALTELTALDAMVHVGMFLGSPIKSGGLGNIGGVSLDVAYRFGF